MTPLIDAEIDRLILGSMEQQEEIAFLESIKEDRAVLQEIKERKLIAQGIRVHRDLEIRRMLKAIHTEVIGERQENARPSLSSGRSYWRIFYVAAGILLIIGILWWAFFQKPNSEKLYAGWFEPYPLSLNTRATVPEDHLNRAIQFYHDRQYDEALEEFAQLEGDKSLSPQVQMAIGVCQLATHRLKEAETTFIRLMRSKDNLYEEEARWYLILSLVRADRIKEATAHLTILVGDPSSARYEQARQLLLELK